MICYLNNHLFYRVARWLSIPRKVLSYFFLNDSQKTKEDAKISRDEFRFYSVKDGIDITDKLPLGN